MLKYYNYNEVHEITMDLGKFSIQEDVIYLDPFLVENGFIRVLIKNKIIKEVTGMAFYGNVEVPVCKINMGILRDFDKSGMRKYKEERMCMYN